MSENDYYPRYAKPFVLEALEDTPVVLIHGARQSGKTTLAKQIAQEKGYHYISFDNDNMYQAAQTDPVGFIRDLPEYVVLDEIQRLPEIFTSIKASVDCNRKPGRFILTGSANVLLLPRLSDSLAGRMEVIQLRPLAQVELTGQPADFLTKLFNGQFNYHQTYPVLGQSMAEMICSGGYPAALARFSERRRLRWYSDYITTLIQRDVQDIARVYNLNIFPLLLTAASGQTAQLFNVSDLAGPFSVSRPTIREYISFLEQLFLIEHLPPWHNNQLSRLIKTTKLHVTDTGLACALQGFNSVSLWNNRTVLGHFLETFVYQELRKQADWQDDPLHFYHFRNKEKNEVDLIIQKNKQFVGVEVKSSGTVKSTDFIGLRKVQAVLGEDFQCGIVLYDGNSVLPFGERLMAVPMGSLIKKPE